MRKLHLSMAILFLAGALHAAGQDLQIGFDDKGLSSISHNGVELLKPEYRRFRVFDVNFVDNVRRSYEPKPKSQSFDAEKNTLFQEYEGFRVECAFKPKADRLDMQITIENNGADTISECTIYPLVIRLPNTMRNSGEWGRNAFLCDIYEHEKGTVAVTPTGWKSGYFYLRDERTNARALQFTGPYPEQRPHHPVVDDAYWYEPGNMLRPGEKGVYNISLVFGSPNATSAELCPDAYDAYAKANPMILKWPDRRPIASAFLCNPATGWKTNPRGYFQNPKIDITTEEGVKAFGESLMKYADTCIERMKKMDAQGIIVWDIEGQEMPHMISYIGDPRLLSKLSPEMDRFADAFMKKFLDAGFKTGITLRPTQVYAVGELGKLGKLAWNHREVKDPVADMSEKIKVAQKRWGCTIFYLDSSVFGKDFLTEDQKAEMRNIPWVMPKAMFEKLARLHPDCLICPEWADRDNYRFGAPYKSPNLGQGGTDPLLHRFWPQAFSIVGVSPDLIEKKWDQYTDQVENGDVLLFMPWYDAPSNFFVQLLYQEVAIRRSGAVEALAKASIADLAKKAADPAEATRYAAATALGKSGAPAAVAILAGLLKDESPLVRKQALAGLANAEKIDDPSCVAMLIEWIKGGKDPVQNALRGHAAEALAKGGAGAVPALLGLLADTKAAGARSYAIQALGKTGTADPKAEEALISCLKDDLPANARLRIKAIEALGLLKVKDSVPPLLQILGKRDRDSEEERAAAVVALGRIGDERAIKPLIDHFSAPYSTMVMYSIKGARETALRSITGEQNVLGGKDWLKWYESRVAQIHKTESDTQAK